LDVALADDAAGVVARAAPWLPEPSQYVASFDLGVGHLGRFDGPVLRAAVPQLAIVGGVWLTPYRPSATRGTLATHILPDWSKGTHRPTERSSSQFTQIGEMGE
jgi:hypothetical protein